LLEISGVRGVLMLIECEQRVVVHEGYVHDERPAMPLEINSGAKSTREILHE